MARRQYFIVLHQGEWKINIDGHRHGPYGTQRDAIKAAVELAHDSGQDSQVLVQGANNQFRTEWTYGHDPYPPPG